MYSLSIRVRTTINKIPIFTLLCFFLRQYHGQRKCFLSERELKKALRDTLTRAVSLVPSNFSLARSEHAHASYPGLFFRPPGFSPHMGREESRVQGLDYSSLRPEEAKVDPGTFQSMIQLGILFKQANECRLSNRKTIGEHLVKWRSLI